MRHNKKKLNKLKSGVQKKQNLIRNMATSLIKNGEIVTTYKKGQVLKSEIDSLLARMVRMFDNYETDKDVRREAMRAAKDFIYTDSEGKKIVNELLPRYKEEDKKSGFVTYYKLWFRKGDGAEKVLVRLT